MKVAFIGMGTMGAPMALNILKAGHEVTVHNRTRKREKTVAEAICAVGAILLWSVLLALCLLLQAV